VLKGNKPDFHEAMTGDISKPMYEDILKQLGEQYKPEAIKGIPIANYPHPLTHCNNTTM